jgi:hypothetical protein
LEELATADEVRASVHGVSGSVRIVLPSRPPGRLKSNAPLDFQPEYAGRLVMAIYRFYILNPDATLKGSATRLDFPDDSVAINHAEQMIGGHSVELWQNDRRVGRFACKRLARPKGVEARR